MKPAKPTKSSRISSQGGTIAFQQKALMTRAAISISREAEVTTHSLVLFPGVMRFCARRPKFPLPGATDRRGRTRNHGAAFALSSQHFSEKGGADDSDFGSFGDRRHPRRSDPRRARAGASPWHWSGAGVRAGRGRDHRGRAGRDQSLLLRTGLWPRLLLRAGSGLLRTWSLRLLRRTLLSPAPLLAPLVSQQSPEASLPGFLFGRAGPGALALRAGAPRKQRRASGKDVTARTTAVRSCGHSPSWSRNIPRARVRTFPAWRESSRHARRSPRVPA